MKRISHIGVIIAAASLAITSHTLAQTGAGDPQDMPEPTKIFSPYVERTVADSNFAEGVYWGDTH